jgi:ubiquinone/menaquinone biosynthesis C-methylase UbiE
MRLVRSAFWVLYNPMAWTYDWVSKVVSLGHWRGWQRTALPELCGKQVLELAFGTGDMLLDLHAAQYRVIGLDLSPTMVRIAQQKLSYHGVHVPLARGRTQQLPFADASFDSVLSTFPAEFIAAPDTLREIARILRPGGRAVVVVLAQLLPNGLWARFLEWLYAITGQRGPLPDLQPELKALGLHYQTMWKAADGGSVLLAVLEKQIDV